MSAVGDTDVQRCWPLSNWPMVMRMPNALWAYLSMATGACTDIVVEAAEIVAAAGAVTAAAAVVAVEELVVVAVVLTVSVVVVVAAAAAVATAMAAEKASDSVAVAASGH